MNADVADVNDVRTVIHEFYDSIVEDPAIGHFFRDVDWSHHLPKMVRFWSAVALAKPGETVEVTFTVPSEPGEYPYICTYPAHFMTMRGVLIVS